MVLHGILGGSELMLRDDVVLVVFKVALAVRVAQPRRGVALVMNLVLLLLMNHFYCLEMFWRCLLKMDRTISRFRCALT